MISNSIIRFDNSNTSAIDRSKVLTALEETIQKFNLDQKATVRELGPNEIEVIGLEGLPLHNFTLRCEALGKQVDYERQTVICVQ